MAIKKTTLKGIILSTGEKLTIALSGLFKTLAEKNLSGHEKECVFITLENEAKYKTDLQNKLFHKLIDIYFESGQFDFSSLFSRPPESKAELKIDIKARHGDGAKLIENRGALLNLKPGAFIEVFKSVFYLMSWSEYTKTQARLTLDNLMNEMLTKGINIDNEKTMFEEIYNKPEKKPELPIF